MTVNYKFKTEPYAHQITALDRSIDRKEYAFFAEMGCVDADTEYLSPGGPCRSTKRNPSGSKRGLKTW